MNQLVPTAPRSFAELEMIPLQREVAQATPLEQIFAAVYRQRYVIAGALGACILLALIVSLVSPKQYTAYASVQLEQQTPRLFGDKDLDPQLSMQDADRFLQTELDLIRSRSLADAVATKLQVEKSPAALKALGVDPAVEGNAHEAAVTEIQNNVKAALGLNTRLAQISFTSGDANLSARVANGFAEAMVDTNLDAKLKTSAHAKQYLMEQLADAKERLESSERQMLAYARRADLTTTVVPNSGDNSKGGSLRSQELGLMADSLAQATARRIDAEQRWQQVQRSTALSLPEVQENKAVQDLVAQKAQLQAALEEDRQRHTDDYPSVRETAAKIHELDSQMSSFASSIKSSFYGRYLAASQQERQMAQTVSGMRGSAMSERERSVGYNSLSREVETNKAFYDGLLQRYKEIAAGSGAAAGNVTIIDQAWPPALADSANLVRNVALGGTAGLIIALFVGGLRERMHDVVRSSDDIERKFNMPALGVVPRITGPEDVDGALADPNSAQAEAYHSVAVALQEACGGVLPKTLLITSSTASEGKSTSALGIARSLSAMGKRVLLIDGDLRRPSSTKLLPNLPKPGLSDVLAGSATPEKTVEHNDKELFNVVGAGKVDANPVTLLAADRIKSVFNKLAAKHDIVIIDGPPIMGLADAVLLARSVDAVLVVVEANRTHMSELDIAISRLGQNNVVGGIITKFDARTAGVRYGGSDYYTYRQRD
jgi:polysaccharide biosynthesis transport protein